VCSSDLLLRSRTASAATRDTPAAPPPPPMQDPRKLLPSKQLPKKPVVTEPKPSPPPPPVVEPGATDWAVVVDTPCGPSRIRVKSRIPYAGDPLEWAFDIYPNDFVARWGGLYGLLDWGTGYKSQQEAFNAATKQGSAMGMCVPHLMLQNKTTDLGRDVAFWSTPGGNPLDSGVGVEMDHRADPASLTGVTIFWRIYGPDDAQLAEGSDSTEDMAMNHIVDVALLMTATGVA